MKITALKKVESNLCEVLSALMTEGHIDSNKLSQDTGIPVPTINRLRSDRSCNPTLATLLPIANFFSISINQLIGAEPLDKNRQVGTFNPHFRQTKSVPIIPIEQLANSNKDIDFPVVDTSANVSENAFAILVKTAFASAQFPENTILIFDKNLEPKDRDYVVVRLEGHQKPTLRQLLIDGDDHYFKPLSAEFGGVTFSKNHEILGVMVQTLTNYRE